jgi:uncharacterized protein (DUF924 family)
MELSPFRTGMEHLRQSWTEVCGKWLENGKQHWLKRDSKMSRQAEHKYEHTKAELKATH